MTDSNCIFCKLAHGEFPTVTVYEDEFLRAVMDISPANKGHMIILPKFHAENIFSLPNDYVEKAFLLAKKLAAAVKEVTACDGVNLLQNNGEAAGQTVFHFHVHVIPRFKEDNCRISWKPGEYADGEAREIAEKLIASLS